jgi:Uma2 family endonuclease
MSSNLARRPLISVEEYLAGEEIAEIKHEYVAGQVFAMTGASIRHNRICGNLYAKLHGSLGGGPCQVFIADVKLHCFLGHNDLFYYPDLMVCCDPREQASHYREHPCLLVEVLSDSTRGNDLREKLMAYTRIDALQAYLVLEQDRPEAILYRRDREWDPELLAGPEARLSLPCGAGLEIVLGALYDH